MKDIFCVAVLVTVVAFFFALLSASVSINSYYKEPVDEDFEEVEYDEYGIAK